MNDILCLKIGHPQDDLSIKRGVNYPVKIFSKMSQIKATTNFSSVSPITGFKQRQINADAFKTDFAKWSRPAGPLLFERTHEAAEWVQNQKKSGLWLYNRAMLTGASTEVLAMDDANNVIYGINFASTDFLGLAQNSTTKEEAIKAVLDFGCNSAGSPLAFGATKYYRQLRDEIADFWKMKSVMIYSAGWLAGYGVFKGLLKEWDHVVMDELCHNSLQEGASAVTSNVHRFPHLNQSAMEAKLKEIRSKDLGNSIMLVTEGLFYMDSSSPNLVEYQRLAKLYNAYFLISCSNDFGCMGPGGRGIWELQGLKDRSNVLLLGSGSKTLSVNIGFLACDDDHVIEYMKILSTTYMFTNAINPVQANTSLNNLRIIASEHGKQLRKQVLSNAQYLRDKLEQKGYKLYGVSSPVIPMRIGNEILCRLVVRTMMDEGIFVNNVQYPAVPIGEARIMINLHPQHTREHLNKLLATLEKCLGNSQRIFDKFQKEINQKTQSTKANL